MTIELEQRLSEAQGIEALLRILENESLAALMQAARMRRDRAFGGVVTYSRKVFIPLTQLCRNVCGYCTFAKAPKHVDAPFLSADQILDIARAGVARGCREALFTLGERPELRYPAARAFLDDVDCASTVDYLARAAKLVFNETGLLPHINAGSLKPDEIALLRPVSVSMGAMLETASERLAQRGGPHFGAPDKAPQIRLRAIEDAGRLRTPFTTGLLIGIGETRRERMDALRRIRALHENHGHIQEVIIQNFRAKPRTRMAHAPEPALDDFLWSIATARLLLPDEISVQAPPNLNPAHLDAILQAGANDWGGVSPVTPDHVNPERPWPHVDALSDAAGRNGKTLAQRLALYPRYVRRADDWVDAGLARSVRRLSDSEGAAREDDWEAGGETPAPPPPTRIPYTVYYNSALNDLIGEIERHGAVELKETEIEQLFSARGGDFHRVCALADEARRANCGDAVTYVVNRNINYTNICRYRCAFCAFAKGKTSPELRGAPVIMPLSEIAQRAREAAARGASEVCLQGGIHPDFTGETYLEICSTVADAAPELHIHAFSPLEILHGATSLNWTTERFLEELKARGLRSLPGTAAEILCDDVRSVICPDKLTSQEWLDVIKTAHAVGLPTTSTMMFGHVEQPIHWARHLLALKELQERTHSITEFVPLPFVAREAPMFLRGEARAGPTFREALLVHAVSRLVLGPSIRNIQTSWVKMGRNGGLAALQAGANDFGGVLMNESITRAAGARHGQEMPVEDFKTAIASIGRRPVQRTTLYEHAAHRPTVHA